MPVRHAEFKIPWFNNDKRVAAISELVQKGMMTNKTSKFFQRLCMRVIMLGKGVSYLPATDKCCRASDKNRFFKMRR